MLLHVRTMIRPSLRESPVTLWWRTRTQRFASSNHSTRFPPSIDTLGTPEENAQAREWIASFRTSAVPKGDVELTYSRSSGPGGQNVNKVNTKATLRCHLKSPWMPLWAKDTLKKSPAYVSSSESILITSSVHRSQPENVQECLSKLHALILSAAESCLVNEPSKEQRQRVERLQRAEKARRRQDKDRRSAVKKGRKGGGD